MEQLGIRRPTSASLPDLAGHQQQHDRDNVGLVTTATCPNGFLEDEEQWPSVHVDRPVFTQSAFDAQVEGHQPAHRKTKLPQHRLKGALKRCQCNSKSVVNFVCKIFPFIGIMRTYNVKTDIVKDLISGLTVGVMQIPQGMAYGMLASVAPVYGLYTSFFPVIVYFFFGTSKHISLGTFAVISLMVGSVVEKSGCESAGEKSDTNNMLTTSSYTSSPPVTTEFEFLLTSGNWSENMTLNSGITKMPMSQEEIICRINVAAAVTLVAGVMQLAMGILHLGFVTIYLSEPLTCGFTTGAAIHVFSSQVKHVFGISTAKYSGPLKLIYMYIELFSKITKVNFAALIFAVICILVLVVTKEVINDRVKKYIKMPLPVELFVVVFGTIASYYGQMESKYQLSVVGDVPTGIPPPSVPSSHIMSAVLGDAFGIAIVAFAISVSMAKLLAKNHGYEIDSNQELVAYGLSNGISSLFNCFMSAASLSRSLVQESVGGQTQIAGLISAALLLVVLLALGPLFEQLPNSVLAAIIIVALKGMFLQFKDLKRLWAISKYDFLIWLVTFIATVLLDVDLGLAVGVSFSLLTVIFRTQRAHTCILGRVPNTDIYKDLRVYSVVEEIPGVKIFRFEASLYYANCEHFVTKLFHKSEVNPRKLALAQAKAQQHIKRKKKKVPTATLR